MASLALGADGVGRSNETGHTQIVDRPPAFGIDHQEGFSERWFLGGKIKTMLPERTGARSKTQQALDLGCLDGQNRFAAGQLLTRFQGNRALLQSSNSDARAKPIRFDGSGNLLRDFFHATGGIPRPAQKPSSPMPHRAVRSWNLNLPVETGTLSNLLSIEPLEMVFFGQKIPLFYNRIPKSKVFVTGTCSRRLQSDPSGLPITGLGIGRLTPFAPTTCPVGPRWYR